MLCDKRKLAEGERVKLVILGTDSYRSNLGLFGIIAPSYVQMQSHYCSASFFFFFIFMKTLIWMNPSCFCGYIHQLFMSSCLYCLCCYATCLCDAQNITVFNALETGVWTHPNIKWYGIIESQYVTLHHLLPFFAMGGEESR